MIARAFPLYGIELRELSVGTAFLQPVQGFAVLDTKYIVGRIDG